MGIFQDEPDEDSSPTAFQIEKEEGGISLFQDEVEEQHGGSANSYSVPRQSRDLKVLGEEPDEGRGPETDLFGDEGDEDGSDSSNSAYLADCENDCSNHQQQLVRQQDRLTALLSGRCKCQEGSCFKQFKIEEVQSFLDTFQKMSKQDQDAVLFLAAGSQISRHASRREFVFLDKPLKRACFEALMGISSHRTDRIGALDLRYGKHDRPSPLTASIDSFAMILYNSVAEPLPDRLVRIGPAKRRAKRPEDLSNSDSQHGTCVVSEFEDKDDDLVDYLQANTTFIMAMQTTNAFTATHV
eukprot:s1822_g7.t1